MIDTLITSRTRIKLLIRLFLNSSSKAYLKGLAAEFGESSNAVRLELNRFEQAGLLNSSQDGIKKMYQANTGHPLYDDIRNLLLKHLGFDQIIEKVVEKLGDLRRAFITGDYARGLDTGTINLLLVGRAIDMDYLNKLVQKAEKVINRTISCEVCGKEDEEQKIKAYGEEACLLLWEAA